MAKVCKNCGKELPFLDRFTGNSLCYDCDEALGHKLPAQLAHIEESIKASHTCTPDQGEILKQYDRETVFDFYYNLCYYFATSNGFDEQDLATLLCVQRAASLSNQAASTARNFAVTVAHKKELFFEFSLRAKAHKKELSAANELNPVTGGGEAKGVIFPSGEADTQMDEQKYCRYCGAVNPTRAIFCAQCGREFTSASAGVVRPTSPSPPPPPSTPQPSPPPPPRKESDVLGIRITRKRIAAGFIVLLLIGAVVVALGGGGSNSSNPGVVTPSAAPTAAPTAQPSAGITPLTSAQLAKFESNLEGQGDTITRHFTQNGTTPDGYPIYNGMMTKDGVTYGGIIVQTDSTASALLYMPTAVSIVENNGFTGSYNADGSWSGFNSDLVAASVGQSGNVVITVLGQ